MQVSLLRATDRPERLVCRAARNDYSEQGVIGRSYGDIMQAIEPAESVPESVLEQMSTNTLDERETLHRRTYALCERLLNHGHFGPFEHPQLTFAMNGISRSCMAQLTRHRHASFDVQSMRYVSFDVDDEESVQESVIDIPEMETAQPAGRNAEIDDTYETLSDSDLLDERIDLYSDAVTGAFETYSLLLSAGVAPENARMVLPIGTKVNVVCSVNLRVLLHIADLRAAGDAQWEIRELTGELLDVAADCAPATMHIYRNELQGRKNRLAP